MSVCDSFKLICIIGESPGAFVDHHPCVYLSLHEDLNPI